MTARLSGQVAIVGVGYSEVARRSDHSLGHLAVDACNAALEDAGLTPDQIDGIANYPHPSRPAQNPVDGVDIVGVEYVSRTMRLANLRWVCSINGGTVTASMVAAVHALCSGACDYALVWRGMHNPPGGRFGRVSRPHVTGNLEFTAPWGFGHNVAQFAFPYSRYMGKYGATREQLATFMVRNRANAAENPNAVFYGKPITVDDYVNARMIVEPLSLLDCDMPVDGCGAIVLTTAARARDLRQKPVLVSGCAALGVPPRRSLVLTLEDFMSAGRQLARSLWSSAGMTISDITHAQLYDGFSYFPCLWLEVFGIFPEGEAFLGIQDDTTTRDGKLPICTSGGALGMGRLHGTPQVIEAVLQIQGRAGARQIADPSVALVQTGSPYHLCAALILSA